MYQFHINARYDSQKIDCGSMVHKNIFGCMFFEYQINVTVE